MSVTTAADARPRPAEAELEEARRRLASAEADRDRWLDRAQRVEEALWQCVSPRQLREADFDDLADAMERAAQGGGVARDGDRPLGS